VFERRRFDVAEPVEPPDPVRGFVQPQHRVGDRRQQVIGPSWRLELHSAALPGVRGARGASAGVRAVARR
jgi:hypothetical protein